MHIDNPGNEDLKTFFDFCVGLTFIIDKRLLKQMREGVLAPLGSSVAGHVEFRIEADDGSLIAPTFGEKPGPKGKEGIITLSIEAKKKP
jgi:hypothetical protein